MENPLNKIKMILAQGVYSRIILILMSTLISGNNYNREGKVKLFSIQTSDTIVLTLDELRRLLDKFAQSRFDGVIAIGDWPTPLPSPLPISALEPIKLFVYECGECFSVHHKNKRVIIDRNIIQKLHCFEQKLKFFLDNDSVAE